MGPTPAHPGGAPHPALRLSLELPCRWVGVEQAHGGSLVPIQRAVWGGGGNPGVGTGAWGVAGAGGGWVPVRPGLVGSTPGPGEGRSLVTFSGKEGPTLCF